MNASIELTHCAFYTRSIKDMTEWYVALLDGNIVTNGEGYAFITNDGEHHRIALVKSPDPDAEHAKGKIGFYHSAFRARSLSEMIRAHDRLRGLGIVPYRTANHVLTFSLYYEDPDGNGVELYVDTFDSTADAKAYMNTPRFAANPVGTPSDIELIRKDLASGRSEMDIKRELRA